MPTSIPEPALANPAADVHLSAGQIFIRGIRKASSGALWVYKILVPISFLTMLLQFSRLIDRLDGVLGPVMGVLHLPAKAAMPLLAGVFTGIYGDKRA